MWNRKQRRIEELQQERRQVLAIALQLLLLAEGCTKHPSYRAVRKPTATCTKCAELFAIRQMLNENSAAEELGYVPRTGKRGKSRKS